MEPEKTNRKPCHYKIQVFIGSTEYIVGMHIRSEIMDSLELLSQQIQQYQQQNQKQMQIYQEQNEKDHEKLETNIKENHSEMMAVVQVLTSETASNKKINASLEDRQKEIKDTIDAIDKRVKGLEDHQLKREHSWNTFLKWTGAIATIGAITSVILKLFGVF